MTTVALDGQRALDLDAADELPTLRSQFHVPPHGDGEVAYFAGNSLGLQPVALRHRLGRELDDWARLGVEGHGEAARPWVSYHQLLREPAARLVGVGRAIIIEEPRGQMCSASGSSANSPSLAGMVSSL